MNTAQMWTMQHGEDSVPYSTLLSDTLSLFDRTSFSHHSAPFVKAIQYKEPAQDSDKSAGPCFWQTSSCTILYCTLMAPSASLHCTELRCSMTQLKVKGEGVVQGVPKLIACSSA